MKLPPVDSRGAPLGKYRQLARERNARDHALAAQPGGHPKGFWYDAAAAERVVRFIEGFCKHHKGEWAGKPLLLEDWQKDEVLRPLFGWKRADGTRRFRKAWIEIPRKNGKTEIAAGIGAYLLVADGEAGAEVYATATTRPQAKLLYDASVAMVKASPDLSRYVKSMRSNGGTLVCEKLSSTFKPLSSDFGTLDGLSPHGDLRDEVHAWTDHGLSKVLDTATGARRQPLTVEITTAGVYDPEGVGWKHHEYATQILEGDFEDDRVFVFIASIDEEDDPFDPATWAKANPNLGVSVKIDFIREQAEEARRSPTKLNDFLQLHLNRWTQQVTRWLSVEKWKACDPLKPGEALAQREQREKELEQRGCAAGMDLSSKLDLTALVLVFPSDPYIDVVCRFWLPEATIEEYVRKGQRHYEHWVREGWIIATPGNKIDHGFIRREVNELAQRYRIGQIGLDPSDASQISSELADDGFTVVEIQQGFTHLSEPSKDLEARIVDGKVRHAGNPVLAWMVGNAVAKRNPSGQIRPDKQKAKGKIDGVVALVMGLSRANLGGAGPDGGSYLETEGLVIV